MARNNKLLKAPPFAIEGTLKLLGANLRTARLRRNFTIQHVAEMIGTGRRAIADAEKGKLTTGVGIYAGLLWAFDLLEQLEDVASPLKDEEGQALALLKEGKRARQRDGGVDNDF